ncbi:DNA replication licensing factor MCM6 [Nematocida sp. LUAm3]|nr:DNA replication licensing factor MCM6 [Nematocida sp. LUAm3]KAI5175828.1 DNA replication licensing factor MCM6 [Nematocida sp. LUAm2]KAI5178324.1 DNA replication licensing factor MCM6 [Nematocida sp. LUAm1]
MKELVEQFVEFLEGTHRGRERFYIGEIEKAIEENRRAIPIYYQDIIGFNQELGIYIKRNYAHREAELAKALDLVKEKHHPGFQEKGVAGRKESFFPCIYGLEVIYSVRDMKTNMLEQLVSFSGIVTRTSQVRPELLNGAFECGECRAITKNIPQERKYTQPAQCINPICMNRSKFKLVVEESHFCDWQKLRIQEPIGELETAHVIPRSLEVLLRDDLVEIVKPGDNLVVTGYLMAVPTSRDHLGQSTTAKTGLTKMPDAEATRGKAAQCRSINHELLFRAVSLSKEGHLPYTTLLEKENRESSKHISELERIKFQKMLQTPDLLRKLANSLFPSICGHENIKIAILLMLVGGVSKTTEEGIPLRGDINILLVGDPGTAKSQFLKQTVSLVDRGVYTSGKGSSAAGLTASVVKDETGEFSIEAGALMLSDNGVCCIDEFDKMDERDRVAIHEAMEQQCISISKGGIHATLGARASILAAANPVRGRYDLKKTLRQNVRLSAPIMSRFDLFFVLVDSISIEHDQIISKYILRNHMKSQRDENDPETQEETGFYGEEMAFAVEDVKFFIQAVKNRKPELPEEAGAMMVEKYLEIRRTSSNHSFAPTPRQLESIIRLSEAVAKIHGLTQISVECVEQAFILLSSSIMDILVDDIKIRVCDVIGEREVVLTYDEYIKMTSSLVYIIQREERNNSGISQENLIKEYIESNESQINTEEEYHQLKEKLEGLVYQLIHKEGVLYAQEGSNSIHIHPNYAA